METLWRTWPRCKIVGSFRVVVKVGLALAIPGSDETLPMGVTLDHGIPKGETGGEDDGNVGDGMAGYGPAEGRRRHAVLA